MFSKCFRVCVCVLGKTLGFTFNNKNFHNVSLGQGQEVVAEQALDEAAKEGHWVILQVHTRTHGGTQTHARRHTHRHMHTDTQTHAHRHTDTRAVAQTDSNYIQQILTKVPL